MKKNSIKYGCFCNVLDGIITSFSDNQRQNNNLVQKQAIGSVFVRDNDIVPTPHCYDTPDTLLLTLPPLFPTVDRS